MMGRILIALGGLLLFVAGFGVGVGLTVAWIVLVPEEAVRILSRFERFGLGR